MTKEGKEIILLVERKQKQEASQCAHIINKSQSWLVSYLGNLGRAVHVGDQYLVLVLLALKRK